MAHRNSFDQNKTLITLFSKKLTTEKNEEKLQDSVSLEDPIISGDVMDMVLEYSGMDKNTEKLGFFNNRGLVSLNAFYTKLDTYHRSHIAKLLNHVVKGEQAEAEAIIKENPEYLFESDQVTDYSGRKIKGTALQIALGAEDVSINPDEECMVEMIQRYLMTFNNGQAALLEQANKQFPPGWKEKAEARKKQDFAALDAVFQAIADAKEGDPCVQAIETFRGYLTDQAKIEITSGWHFNIQMLGKAFHLFHSNFNLFGGDMSHKNNLIWVKVIGYLQRYAPACYAQLFCQMGIYNFLSKSNLGNNTLKNRHGLQLNYSWLKEYFPLDKQINLRLGYEVAVHPGNACAQTTGAGWSVSDDYSYGISLMQYSEKKQQRCETISNSQTDVPKLHIV